MHGETIKSTSLS